MLSFDNQRWLEKFAVLHGRAPRVLHIGNIANNAYNNAKILNSVGIENHVLCYDYYHVMGTPEWEDADFSGELNDDFNPTWYKQDLKGYCRPDWFVQGKLDDCLAYLQELSLGNTDRTNAFRALLSVQNRTSAPLDAARPTRKFRRPVEKFITFGSFAPEEAFTATHQKMVSLFGAGLGYWFSLSLMFFWPLAHAYSKDALRGLFERLSSLWLSTKVLNSRVDCLEEKDVVGVFRLLPKWSAVLKSYDFVIAYSTDPFIPLVVGVPYFAFEHGTLRDIPYATDTQGRRTSLSYAHAKHVFVTNFDCISSAERLAPGRFTLINHPYDEDHGSLVTGSDQLRQSLLARLDAEHLFFFPTRHDWVVGTGYADKANDIFLKAFAELHRLGWKVGLVCCEWGKNVEQSKELLEREGVTQHVTWFAPMAMTRFERMSMACDVVVDQFKLGAFGGVLFKAMATGSPILTYLNEALVLRQYTEVPPVINCRTSSEIVTQMAVLFEHPKCLEEIRLRSRQWIVQYHGKHQTINKQVDQFRLVSTAII